VNIGQADETSRLRSHEAQRTGREASFVTEVLVLPFLAVLSRLVASLTLADHHLGRCVACYRPVRSSDQVSWLNGELHHRECARYRAGDHLVGQAV
jgi:hypothetical protein